MSIKYAILGLLAERPAHGYAVHKAFEERLSDFWELNYGQVYQVLTVLERGGLIVGREERVGKRPSRKVFSVTARGGAALRNWLLSPSDRRRPFRDDFYVRLLFADPDNRDGLCAMIDAEIARCRERLAEMTDRRDAAPTAVSTSYVPRLFAAAAVRHVEADLEALQECRSAVVHLAGAKACKQTKTVTSTPRLATNRTVLRA